MEFQIPNILISFFEEMKKSIFEKLKILVLEYKELWGEEVYNSFHNSTNISKIQEFISDNLEKKIISQIYEELIKQYKDNLAKFLLHQMKLFNKRIVIYTKNLHLYSIHYFKLLHEESNINMLFLKNKTANIHTKLTYVQTTTKLMNMTKWINEFVRELQLLDSSSDVKLIIDSDFSGSNKVKSPKDTKTFFKILTEIEMKNNFSNLTIRMIYIRYIFSISMASRKYYFSVNVKQYSTREKILFIHEKDKNLYTSKRIVPITILCDKYIQYFLKLRKKYQFNSYSPVIFLNNGSVQDFNNENLMIWFNENKEELMSILTEQDFEFMKNFIFSVVLDFGRHIFASKAHNDMNLAQDYIDAMLNHFENGTQDQGMYSLFDNKEYFTKIRNIIEEIEKEYIPFCKYLSE